MTVSVAARRGKSTRRLDLLAGVGGTRRSRDVRKNALSGARWENPPAALMLLEWPPIPCLDSKRPHVTHQS
jgi:hypothetical protein